MTSILLYNNRNEFDKVKKQVKKLHETIKHMMDTEILSFIPEGSYDGYRNIIIHT